MMVKPVPSYYLIFTSRASVLMTTDDLTLLLKNAFQKNQLLGITGMLLYMEIRLLSKLEGKFMQLIEGDEIQIQSLYKKICSDDRHDNILLLASGQQPTASFSNWSMSYSGNSSEYLGYKILEDKLFKSVHFQKGNGPAYFLKTFYDYNLQLQNEYALLTAGFNQKSNH